jgi:predicted enzyme related to lactoylglutathione lyase
VPYCVSAIPHTSLQLPQVLEGIGGVRHKLLRSRHRALAPPKVRLQETLGYPGRVASPIRLVEFPADEPARARRFWNELLGVELDDREEGQGDGWQTGGDGPALGLHQRGTGPGDRVSLPYFSVSDMKAALNRVSELGGEVIHPGERWSVCRDSEGSPFGLVLDAPR